MLDKVYLFLNNGAYMKNIKMIFLFVAGALGATVVYGKTNNEKGSVDFGDKSYLLKNASDYVLHAEFEVEGLKESEFGGVFVGLKDIEGVSGGVFPVSREVLAVDGVYNIERLIHSEAPLVATVIVDAYLPQGATLKINSLEIKSLDEILTETDSTSLAA